MASIKYNGFSVGADFDFTLSDQSGDLFTGDELGYVLEFNSTARDRLIAVEPITNGGAPIFMRVPGGHSGMVRYSRTSSALTQLMLDLDSAWYTSGRVEQFTFTGVTRNRDGSEGTLVWSGVQLHGFNNGRYQGLRDVEQSHQFSASMLQATGTAVSLLQQLLAA